MNIVPSSCPACGSPRWKLVDEANKGFSVGKAVIGGVLLGPVVLAGGALGKKKKIYYCKDCGFKNEY